MLMSLILSGIMIFVAFILVVVSITKGVDMKIRGIFAVVSFGIIFISVLNLMVSVTSSF